VDIAETPYKLNEIKIEVTHDCLLHCKHCSSVSEVDTGRSVNWLTCKRIIDDAASLGATEVAFSGGEPLLWPHIRKAVKQGFKHGMRIFLYTSGNVNDADVMLNILKSLGLNRAMFSIFGANANQHEFVTGVKGRYEKTLKISKYCVDIGLETEYHFVPMNSNYHMLPQIAEQARNFGIKRISVLRLVPQGRGSMNSGLLTHLQNMELRKIVQKLRAEGNKIRLGSPYNFLMLSENPKCLSGIDRLTVGPDLKIHPCDAFKHIPPRHICENPNFANLRDHSLKDCWDKSEYFNIVRNYAKSGYSDECTNCPKIKDCKSGCMAQKFYAYGKLQKMPDPMCLLERLNSGI